MKLLEIPRMRPTFHYLPVAFHDLEHVIEIITSVSWHLASVEEELHSHEAIRANVRVIEAWWDWCRPTKIGV